MDTVNTPGKEARTRSSEEKVSIRKSVFGQFPTGETVHRFTLGDPIGPSVEVSEYGSTLLAVKMPDRQGRMDDVILRHSSLENCIADKDYLGVTVGRYANRITGAKIKIDGESIQLAANQDGNHLHGGFRGFGKKLWKGSVIEQDGIPAVRMEMLSPHDEEGYPGNLQCRATFSFRDHRWLDVVYEAKTDRPTIINMTLHPYFNLAGPGGDLSQHMLTLHADSFLPMRPEMVPTGEVKAVAGTLFDFRKPASPLAEMDFKNEQIKLANGYDHCWILRGKPGEMKLAAELKDGSSGRTVQIHTTAPGLQFYSGNYLGANTPGNGHGGFRPHAAFALEPQAWPDSPSHVDFPNVILRPGELYTHRITYIFGTE